ncbi:MAG: glycosyltransferase family 4 protein [Pyrinomonadaceae bacterium]
MEKVPKKKLWIVTELYYPEMTSTGYYLTKIAEGLAGEFDVAVLCGQPNYSAKGTLAPRKEVRSDVEINRVFGTRLDKNVIPYRILNMLTLGLSVFFRSLWSFRKGDQVLVVTTPPLMPFLTWIASRIKRSEHVLLIHDNYPEILYAVGKLVERSVTSKLLEFASTKLVASADRIILVGRDMKERIENRRGNLDSVFVVPNWAELETVRPIEKSLTDTAKTLNLENKLVFLYAGNFGHPNDIETILNASKTLDKIAVTVVFMFLGAGVKLDSLKSYIKLNDLQNVVVEPPRPRTEQPDFLNSCDIGIVSLVPKMKGVSMPSRTYNLLAAGKPILAICEPGSEVAMVVEEEEAGWVVRPGDVNGMVRLIEDIANGVYDLGKMGRNARKAAVRKYDLDSALRGYRRALGGVESD